MLTYDEALARVLADAPFTGRERIALADAPGRVLCDDVLARAPQPAFDHSAMDGYALRLDDLIARDDRTLAVQGESRTGAGVPAALTEGRACRIFTGAMVPDGADTVVMQEEVARDGDHATFARVPKRGEHIRRRGEDVRAGDAVLRAGTRITPYQTALLASVEALKVTVARRPAVAIVSTGDELREAGDEARAGSVVDANGPALAALVRACGGAPRVLPFARDTLADTERALTEALAQSDLVLTVGGVSVGDHDVVRAAMERAGVSLDFWKVAIRPGKPLCVGTAGRTRVLGLPGNPSSALLTFTLFGAPLLRAMQGDRSPVAPRFEATLDGVIRHQPGRLSFVRARRESVGGTVVVRPLSNQASGAVTSFAWADTLVLVPAEREAPASGERVQCMGLIDG